MHTRMSGDFALEEQALLLCLGATDNAGPGILQAFSEAHWENFLRSAARLGVSPMLFVCLQKYACTVNVPHSALQTLQAAYQANALRNMKLYRALHLLLRTLQDQEIAVAVLKGAYLAQGVYADIALRSMGDIDILVEEAHLPQVETVLAELGYQLDAGKQLEGEPYHIPYVSRTDPTIAIEVHWHLEPANSPFQVDLEGVWQRARPARIAGVEVLALGPEDLLLHLCIHNAHHHLFGHFSLRALCDIRQVIEQSNGGMDWEQVCQRCQQWDCDHSVYLTLLLARQLLEAPIPPQVLQRLRPPQFDPRLAAWAQSRLVSQVDDKIGPWSDHLGQLAAAARTTDKLKLLFQLCFPADPAEDTAGARPAPPARVVPGYLRRLKSLFLHRPHTLLRLMRGDHETRAWLDREAGRTSLARWLSANPRRSRDSGQ